MGKDKERKGWRSVVQDGDTLGDHFPDLCEDTAAAPVRFNDLTPAQVRELQKRHCREQGRKAGRSGDARSNIKGDTPEDREAKELARLNERARKLGNMFAKEAREQHGEELEQVQARIAEIKGAQQVRAKEKARAKAEAESAAQDKIAQAGGASKGAKGHRGGSAGRAGMYDLDA